MTTGRKSDYNKEFNDPAYEACKVGATRYTLAKMFKVRPETITNWKKKFPSFNKAIEDGHKYWIQNRYEIY